MKKVWEEHYLKTGRSVSVKYLLPPKEKIEFYHLVSSEIGNKYFKVDWVNGKCVQIVLDSGKAKKGRPHCLGVYTLAISTFRGTYHWYYGRKGLSGNTHLLATSENQFNKAFEKCINDLKK
jgi:hypothetical protein